MTDTCTSIRCLRAIGSPKRCRCSCAGRLHGAVQAEDTYLDGITEAKHRGYTRMSDLEILAAAW